jgi:hypothetical protein
MAKLTTHNATFRNVLATSAAPEFNDGYIRIYDGSRPALPSDAVTTQVLLAELRFANPAAASITGGVIAFDTIVKDSSANNTGTAAWARCLKSDGTTALIDVSVGTSDANLILSTLSIQATVEVDITSFSFTVAASSAQ